MSNKCSQKAFDHATQSTPDAHKTISKEVTQEIAEVTDDLVGNKTADKVTWVLKCSLQSSSEAVERETENISFDSEIPKERHISPQKRR